MKPSPINKVKVIKKSSVGSVKPASAARKKAMRPFSAAIGARTRNRPFNEQNFVRQLNAVNSAERFEMAAKNIQDRPFSAGTVNVNNTKKL